MRKSSHPKLLHAELWFDYVPKNERESESILKAILPESAAKGKCFFEASLKRKKGKTHLFLYFEAADIASLRASINTNLRLISSAIRTLNSLGNGQRLTAHSREKLNNH